MYWFMDALLMYLARFNAVSLNSNKTMTTDYVNKTLATWQGHYRNDWKHRHWSRTLRTTDKSLFKSIHTHADYRESGRPDRTIVTDSGSHHRSCQPTGTPKHFHSLRLPIT